MIIFILVFGYYKITRAWPAKNTFFKELILQGITVNIILIVNLAKLFKMLL